MRYWLLTGAVDAYHIEPNTRAVPGLAPVSHPKRSLGSLLTSTSKSAMVDMTSSISRPFTVPKTTNGGSSASNAVVVDDDDDVVVAAVVCCSISFLLATAKS